MAHKSPKSAKKPKAPMSHSAMVASGKITHKSKIQSPVSVCWDIFDEHRNLSRKDAMNLAIAAGVAFYTARTQYQAWKVAGDNDRKAAERSAKLMESVGLGKKH